MTCRSQRESILFATRWTIPTSRTPKRVRRVRQQTATVIGDLV